MKVWSESTEEKVVTWRGYITHVPSGKRLHVTDLDKICEFIGGYLAEMGVVLKPGIQRWFRK